jgi:replicative DNA helicase
MSDFISGKILPQNVEVEQSVLCALIINNDCIPDVMEIVSHRDFYKTAHQEIFQTISKMSSEDEPVDLLTLVNRLREEGTLEAVGGATYLATVVNDIPLSVNVLHHARIIAEKAMLRRIIKIAYEILNRCFKDAGDLDGITDFVERAVFKEMNASTNDKDRCQRLVEILEENIEVLEKRQADKSQYTGIPTGFTQLDKLTSGFQNSDLIILAARPSMGKTAFALNIARNAAVKFNVPVIIFSLEMAKEQLGMRLLCSEAKVSSSRMKDGFLSREDFSKIIAGTDALSRVPIFVDDSSEVTVMNIRAKTRRLKMQENLGLIIIDYLQLMKGSDSGSKQHERRDLEIAEITRSLKSLAKELNVPVLALSQLNRMLEQRADKRPMLSDLRESGSIEQDADLVLFIYRDEVYNKDETNPNRGIADILLSKHRNGPTGIASLTFFKEYTLFENLSDGVPLQSY